MADSKQSTNLIRDFHRMGQLILKTDTKMSKTDERLLSRYRTLNDDTQRRIKQFADPILGYTTKELESLLSLCEKHDYAIGFSVLTRLLAIPKERREEAQSLAVKMKWGRRDLNHHIKATLGTRQLAGRRPKRFQDPQLLKAAILATCLSWCRQADSMKKENADAFNQLPEQFKRTYQQITDLILAMEEHDGKAEKEPELNTARPMKKKKKVQLLSDAERAREKEMQV